MLKALIVEDTKFFAEILEKTIRADLQFDTRTVPTLSEAQKILEHEKDDFFVALLDLHLPDAPDGEIVDYVISKGIPVIVFTASLSDDIREKILSKNVVDYVLKGDINDIHYIVHLIKRIHDNQYVKILVVDDSSTSRSIIKKLLAQYKFVVIEAENGRRGLQLLEADPAIKMVITDYQMPGMNGAELVSQIRKKYTKDKLSVIGVSAHGSGALSARFLKAGANDFLIKPFLNEEFYCRVTQNLEMLENIETIRAAANKDYLTKLYNRRYFFDVGRKFIENAKRGNISVAIAMIDIDDFKEVNDSYGHEAGDIVLQHVSALIKNNFRLTDIVARFGGEEFCVLATGIDQTALLPTFEKIRQLIAESEIKTERAVISISVSIGVSNISNTSSLEETISTADQLLLCAKRQGKNRVIVG